MPDYIYPDTDTGFRWGSAEEFWQKLEDRRKEVFCHCGEKAIMIHAEEGFTMEGPHVMAEFTCSMMGWRHGNWEQGVEFK